MRKLIATLFFSLVITFPVMAIEPPKGVVVPYTDKEISYTGVQFNEVLEAYGLVLSPESEQSMPSCFATVFPDRIEFGHDSMRCSPKEFHFILTAYGLMLTPDDVGSRLSEMGTYATVQDGKVVFSDETAFLWSSEWKTILGAYRKVK